MTVVSSQDRFSPQSQFPDWCSRCMLPWSAHKARHHEKRTKRARCPR